MRWLLVLVLAGCSTFDEWADQRLEIRETAEIAETVAEVLHAADLDGDGAIQGRGEWYEFATRLVAAIRERVR